MYWDIYPGAPVTITLVSSIETVFFLIICVIHFIINFAQYYSLLSEGVGGNKTEVVQLHVEIPDVFRNSILFDKLHIF
jgi:hypothetical protein